MELRGFIEMGNYASEIDGDNYTCACGTSTHHSYLLSSKDGFIDSCCKSKGWAVFEYQGILRTKYPDETIADVKRRVDTYNTWYTSVDWDKYHRNSDYRKERSEKLKEMYEAG